MKEEYGIEPTVYVVRTINEYSPILRDVRKFNLPLKVSGLIGKERLCDFEWKWLLKELEGEVNICNVCPKKSMIYKALFPEEFIKTQSFWIPLEKIPKEYCKYRTLISTIFHADITLATLPYLLGRARRFLEMLKPYRILIVDEAHNFENINQFISVSINKKDIDILLRSGFDVRNLKDFFSKFDVKKNELKLIEKEKFIEECGNLDNEIIHEYERILQHHLNGNVRHAKAILRVVRFYRYVDTPYMDLFVTNRGFKLLVTDVSGLINDAIFEYNIFMSGTLPPHDYIRNVWGIDGLYIDVERKLKLFRGNRKYFWVNTVTSKFEMREKNIDKMRTILDKLLSVVPKVVLVVFSSYDYLSRFADLAKKYNAIVEDEKTKIENVENEVKNGGKNIIFAVAGGKLTEGIELVKEGRSMIKTIIIAGVPYPIPDDYNKRKAQKIVEKLGYKGGDVVFRYTVHIPALIYTKQAIGRGIRSDKDYNNVFLLDWRFRYFFDDLGIEKVYLVKL